MFCDLIYNKDAVRIIVMNCGSAVGIATGYKLDNRGVEFESQ
jgi:hypothetical protein